MMKPWNLELQAGTELHTGRGGLWRPPIFLKILNSRYIFKILENKPQKNYIYPPQENYICPPQLRILVLSLVASELI